jgi:hypothetical protein
MTSRRGIGLSAIVTAIVLCLVVLTALSFNTPTSHAAPLAAPTPITAPARAQVPAEVANFWPVATALITDTRSNCIELTGAGALDLQYVIDEGTVNTATLKLIHSNDGVNFVDGVAIASAVAADANAMQQYNIYGVYTCVSIALSNTNPITISAIGVAK